MKRFSTLTVICVLFLATSLSAATNLSKKFKAIYQQQKLFTAKELLELKKYDIILIPGILAESLIGEDDRSGLNLAIITRDYFHEQLNILKNKYRLSVRRLRTSSKNVEETQQNIREAVNESRSSDRKVIFISHSLGGLALLEEVIKNPAIQSDIGGIAFLQSPFYGASLAELMLHPPYRVLNIFKPLLPFLNISPETIEYVGIESRNQFMQENKSAILDFVSNIPVYTFTGVADANKSIFKPFIDLMEVGCIRGIKHGCITEKFFNGPYDKSDGLIPYKSSFIENVDYVIMEDVDHGEFILNVPFEDYSKEHLTTSWLRILLEKMK